MLIRRLAHHWGLMNAMSQKAGVDLAAALIEDRLDRPELGAAIARCAGCESVPECKSHLAGERTAGVPDFCPNRAMLARLAP